jgi:DNA repair protein RecO (recombination protein O)
LEALTREHGRHLGLVRGGVSPKRRAMLQPGNRVKLTWRARLSENLGVFVAELEAARAHDMFASRSALMGLNALTTMANAVLPEREPHGPAFEGAEALIGAIAGQEFRDWGPLFVRWELGLLEELGFGLDLARCAATGSSENLAYVSPRTGRAVSTEPGAAYADRLFALPAFLRGGAHGEPNGQDLLAGLTLTAHFLQEWVLTPHQKTIPEARRRLHDLAARDTHESD